MEPTENTNAPFTVGHAKMLSEIHTALVGNPSMGVKGLAVRTADIEKDVETVKDQVRDHSKKLWLVTVVGGGMWAAVVSFKDKIWPS